MNHSANRIADMVGVAYDALHGAGEGALGVAVDNGCQYCGPCDAERVLFSMLFPFYFFFRRPIKTFNFGESKHRIWGLCWRKFLT